MTNINGSIPKTKGKDSLKGSLTPKNPGPYELDPVIIVEKPVGANSLSSENSQNFINDPVSKLPGELDQTVVIEKPKPIENKLLGKQ